MNTFTNNVTHKVNNYINYEQLRKQRSEYIINNGTLSGKIKTPFATKSIYCLI